MLGPCGPLVCWGGYPCRGVLNTPHRAPPSVANTRPRVPVRPVGAPNHSPGRNPGRAGYVPFGPPGTGRIHGPGDQPFGPGGPFGGRMPFRPGVSPPRVSPWAMVHRAYSPAGYVPFGPCGPFGGRMRYAPTVVRAFGSLRVPGQIRRRPQTPAPTVVRAFGYSASFPAPAGAVRRRPGFLTF